MKFSFNRAIALGIYAAICNTLSSAQSSSSIQFYDSTGATATSKFGWTGDATNGNFFIQTPGNTAPVTVKAGNVTAASFTGDGSKLTGLPTPAATIQDGAVVESKIGAGAVTTTKIGTGAVTTANIAAGAVDSTRLATNAVTNSRILNGAVDSNKIAAGAVTDAKIGSVDWTKVASNPFIRLYRGPQNCEVGIGTTNPGAELSVYEDAEFGDDASGNIGKTSIGKDVSGRATVTLYNSTGWGTICLNAGGPSYMYTALAIGQDTVGTNYMLDVAGAIHATGNVCALNLACSSDRRYKTSITPLSLSLDKIKQLQGVSYEWKRAAFPAKNFPEGKQIGLIAQDVEKVIPEVVHTDADGYKSLSYDKLTAVLVEAVKEQQKTIDAQKKTIDELANRVSALEGHASANEQ